MELSAQACLLVFGPAQKRHRLEPVFHTAPCPIQRVGAARLGRMGDVMDIFCRQTRAQLHLRAFTGHAQVIAPQHV